MTNPCETEAWRDCKNAKPEALKIWKPPYRKGAVAEWARKTKFRSYKKQSVPRYCL